MGYGIQYGYYQTPLLLRGGLSKVLPAVSPTA
jgi:hypothetical protein